MDILSIYYDHIQLTMFQMPLRNYEFSISSTRNKILHFSIALVFKNIMNNPRDDTLLVSISHNIFHGVGFPEEVWP